MVGRDHYVSGGLQRLSGAPQRHWPQSRCLYRLSRVEWIGSLPGAVAAVYEAGPTGVGLARFLLGALST